MNKDIETLKRLSIGAVRMEEEKIFVIPPMPPLSHWQITRKWFRASEFEVVVGLCLVAVCTCAKIPAGSFIGWFIIGTTLPYWFELKRIWGK